jgi:hypothetical protein
MILAEASASSRANFVNWVISACVDMVLPINYDVWNIVRPIKLAI